MQQINIVTGKIPNLEEAINMYLLVGWGQREQYDAARFQKAFDHSKFILAYSDTALVGLIRFISDEAQDTIVSEFIVRPDFQKQGIGKQLMTTLQETYGHTDIYINTPKQYETFFLQNGMKAQTALMQVSRRAA